METTSKPDNAKKDHVTLLTFNVHSWCDAKHKANFSRVMDIFRSLEPDVIGLNEVSTNNFVVIKYHYFLEPKINPHFNSISVDKR